MEIEVRPRSLIGSFLAFLTLLLAGGAVHAEIDFNRDVLPILSNHCFECHGPDGEQRQAGLRLDQEPSAKGELDSGEIAVIPGDVEFSALVARIEADDAAIRMPPEDFSKPLDESQIATLKTWIAEGAEWKRHWSLEPIVRPELPVVSDDTWRRNPIDRFVAAKLKERGLTPEPEADRAKLLRRVTFDLTGLPPTLEELDAFLADESPNAYETAVDRLLASKRYGEHMARYWLDAARYGDTHGLHLDNERGMWPYRDWVISAFNQNKPYDEFIVEQLAGDLLPNPRLEQRVASGFNRCNVTTSEGGSIDEEYYVRYAVDRVETASTVFMGLTLGCAVCHDHKYDPFTQKDFYQLFAFFNNLDGPIMDGNRYDTPPTIAVPQPDQLAELAKLEGEIDELFQTIDAPNAELDVEQAAWEQDWASRLQRLWRPLRPEQVAASVEGVELLVGEDDVVSVGGENPDRVTYTIETTTHEVGLTAIRLEALPDESLGKGGPGRADNGNLVLSEFDIEAQPLGEPRVQQQVKIASARASFEQDGWPASATIDGEVGEKGWALDGGQGKESSVVFVLSKPLGFAGGTRLTLRLKHESPHAKHTLGRFRLSTSREAAFAPAELSDWHVVGPFPHETQADAIDGVGPPEELLDLDADYPGEGDETLAWSARPDFVDGQSHSLAGGSNSATYLYRTIRAEGPRKLQVMIGSDDGLKVWLNGSLLHVSKVQRLAGPSGDLVSLPLAAGDNRLLLKIINFDGAKGFYFQVEDERLGGEATEFAPLLTKNEPDRTDAEKTKLRRYFRRQLSPEIAADFARLEHLEERRREIERSFPTTLVSQERADPRQAYLLIRGDYERRGDPTEPVTPESLPPMPEDAPANRLGLAQWLVHPSHPLTARVAVNRFWQQLFGVGIVKTAEDFGLQGERPSHPLLLDWLAAEFRDDGWDVKALMRLMVTSQAYRQSAAAAPEKYEADPENRLLARGPRHRMDAEVIRDQALALSGLLVPRIGGESVKPYQPGGIWEAVGYTSSNTAKFVQDHDDALYRRSLYTFWKRTAPPANMAIFDAPSRESCTMRRPRTNTPLQALALLNDVQFVEASRKFAERIMHEGGDDVRDRLATAFRMATSRAATPDELDLLTEQYEQFLQRWREHPEDAEALLATGESDRDESLAADELAAWTLIANLLLNLDEALVNS